jgi:hypothetical protein
MKPANHDESSIFLVVTKGLSIGIISGKANFILSLRPQFIAAFIEIILRNPS